MANPRPKLENLKPFKPKGELPMRGRLYVRVTEDVEQAVKGLPNAPDWLRSVITSAVWERPCQETVSKKQEPSPSPGHPPGEVLALLDKLEQTRLTKAQREIVAAIRQRLMDVTMPRQ